MNPNPIRPSSSLALLVGVVIAAGALVAPSAAQVQVDWVAPTAGIAIGVDAADNVFTANYAYALGAEISVTKRDVHGNLLWQASIDQTSTTQWEKATWLGVDGNGDVVVSGTLMSGYSNPVEAASLLLKFAADGTPLFRVVYESGFDGSFTQRCLIDELDDIYVLGMGSGPTGYVTKVKKFAPDGSALWTWFDAAGIGRPVLFKPTPDGALLLSCRAQFGSLNGYAKLDRDGNALWSLAGVQSLTVGDAAGDSLGNTYVVHGEYVTNGGTVVRKLDPQGAQLWQHVYPSSGFRVEVGSDDRAVVSGFPSVSTAGAAFFKVDPSGNLLWANLDADGPLALLLHAQMLLDGANDAYLAAGTLFDMAVCKVNSDGSSAWTATTPGGYARSIALGNTPGSLFVVGGQTARLVEPGGNPDVYSFCQTSPNSFGPGAVLSQTGSLSIAANAFTLQASGSVPGSLGLMYYGGAEVQLPFGDGFKCVGSGALGTFRLVPAVPADASGNVVRPLDFTVPPANAGPGAITPGGTYKFQWWYRDVPAGQSGFNLSDGLSVTFHP